MGVSLTNAKFWPDVDKILVPFVRGTSSKKAAVWPPFPHTNDEGGCVCYCELTEELMELAREELMLERMELREDEEFTDDEVDTELFELTELGTLDALETLLEVEDFEELEEDVGFLQFSFAVFCRALYFTFNSFLKAAYALKSARVLIGCAFR